MFYYFFLKELGLILMAMSIFTMWFNDPTGGYYDPKTWLKEFKGYALVFLIGLTLFLISFIFKI
jgi:hypothetical protein